MKLFIIGISTFICLLLIARLTPFEYNPFYYLNNRGVLKHLKNEINEHRNGNLSAGVAKKDFATYEVVGDNLTRRESRNLESAILNREVKNPKMLNKRRNDNGFYHSYDEKSTLTDGRKVLHKDEVDALLEESSKNQVDPKTHKKIDCGI